MLQYQNYCIPIDVRGILREYYTYFTLAAHNMRDKRLVIHNHLYAQRIQLAFYRYHSSDKFHAWLYWG